MAKGTRNVDLVIRAKDEAGKALGAVSGALKELRTSQEDAKKGSEGTASTLEKLGNALSRLKQDFSGDPVKDLSRSMAEAENVAQTLKAEIDRLGQAAAQLSAQQAKASETANRLADRQRQLTDQMRGQQQNVDEAKAAFKGYQQEAKAAAATIDGSRKKTQGFVNTLTRQEAALAKAKSAYTQLAQEVAAADAPSAKLIDRTEKAEATLRKHTNALRNTRDAFATYQASVEKARQDLPALEAAQERANRAMTRAKAAQDEAATALRHVGAAAKAVSGELRDIEKASDRNAQALEKQEAALEGTEQRIAELGGSGDKAVGGLRRLTAVLRGELLGVLRESRTELDQYKRQWDDASRAVGQAWRDSGGMGPPTRATLDQIDAARQAKKAFEELGAANRRLMTDLRAAKGDITLIAAAQNRYNVSLEKARAASAAAAAASKQQGQAVAGVTAATTNAVAATTRQAAAQRRLSSAYRVTTTEAQQTADAMETLRRRGRQAMTWTQRLHGEVVALTLSYVGLYAGIEQLRGVTTAFMQIEAAQSRMLSAFNGDEAVMGRELRWTREQADRLGIQFGILAQEYSKFAIATRGTNIEGAKTREIFKAVAEAARVNKLSNEQLEGTLLALSQMASKGVVSMEELRRQMGDRLYGAFTLAAEAMGLTGKELNDLISTGSLATDEFLPRFAKRLTEVFGPQLAGSLDTFTTKLGRFQNEILKAQLEVAGGGFIEGLSAALDDLTTFFKSDEGTTFFANLGKAAGLLVQGLAALPRLFDEIVAVMLLIIGTKSVKFIESLGDRYRDLMTRIKPLPAAMNANATAARRYDAAGRTINATNTAAIPLWTRMRTAIMATGTTMSLARMKAMALTGTLTVLRGAMLLVGGLPGLLVLGITAAAYAFIGRTREVIDVTGRHEAQVQKVIDAYTQAREEARDWAEAIKEIDGVKLEDVEINFAAVKGDFEQQMQALVGQARSVGQELMFQHNERELGKQISDLAIQLKDGEITAEAFNAALDAIYEGTESQRVRGLMQEFREMRVEVQASERDLAEAAFVLEQFGGNAGEAAGLADRLGISLRQLARDAGFENFTLAGPTEAISQVSEAIAGLRSELDGIGAQDKRMQQLKDIQATVQRLSSMEGIELLPEPDQRLFARRIADLQAVAARLIDQIAGEAVTSQTVDRIVAVESNGDPEARNPGKNQTATGLGQFIESTWLEMFRRHFPDRAKSMGDSAILALRTDADLSRKMIEAYAQDNARLLARAGESVNDASIYLAHFLGPSGAIKVMQAAANTPLSDLLTDAVIEANQSVMEGQTAGDLIAWAQDRIGLTETELGLQQQLSSIEQQRANDAAQAADKAQSYTDELTRTLNRRQQDLTFGKGLTRELTIQRVIEDEKLRAAKAGVTLTQAQLTTLREITGAQWDIAEADRQRQAHQEAISEREEDLNRLMQHRRDLMEQIQFYEAEGNTDAAEQKRQILRDIEAEIRRVIDAYIDFLSTMDGPEADAAIARLEAIRMGLANVKMGAILTKETVGQALGANIASGADSFLAKIRETGKVMSSAREAFRQFASDFLLQIAQMILKQAIFNALQAAMGGPGGGGTFGQAVLGAIHHDGGIVGSGMAPTRAVAPGWFTNAVRYHSGGIAGLKPGEVPAILQKGEEVLPKDDPRHRGNAGASGAAPNVKIVNSIDAADFISQGVSDVRGQKAILNFMKANPGAVRGALGL